MNVSRQEDFSSIRKSDVFRVYSHRLARLMVLRHICPQDHPVLTTEISLIEIAKSRLHEYLLSRITPAQMQFMKPGMEAWIRALTHEDLLTSPDIDMSVKKAAIELLGKETLQGLIPGVQSIH